MYVWKLELLLLASWTHLKCTGLKLSVRHEFFGTFFTGNDPKYQFSEKRSLSKNFREELMSHMKCYWSYCRRWKLWRHYDQLGIHKDSLYEELLLELKFLEILGVIRFSKNLTLKLRLFLVAEIICKPS